MDRSQAYETLNLHPSADSAMVADAYWRMVRIAQGEGDTPETQRAIERLNEAYAALNPKSAPRPPRMQAGQAALQQIRALGWALDVFADWWSSRHVYASALARPEPQLGLIGGATLFLMLLAVSAGASILLSFVAALVVAAAIWAPWRKLD